MPPITQPFIKTGLLYLLAALLAGLLVGGQHLAAGERE
jgi:hypothetical protein